MELILDNLYSPTHLVSHPITKDLYITDQLGYIYRVTKERKETELWLDLTDLIIPLNPNYDESGLLSIEFSSDGDQLFLFSSRPVTLFPKEGFLFVLKGLNRQSKDLHVDVISMIPLENGNPLLDEEIIYFGILRDQRNHHGGKLAYLDDYLYISIGDGGGSRDPYQRAQDLTCVAGKILRIVPSREGSASPMRKCCASTTSYYIPENPFINTEKINGSSLFIDEDDIIPEIYAYGFRNPWSLTYSPFHETFFIGDVGQEDVEEIDLLVESGNYGWSVKEGSQYTPWLKRQDNAGNGENFIDPIFEYPHREDGISAVIGGYYISGNPRYPEGYYLADILGPVMRIVDEEGEWHLDKTWDLDDDEMIQGWGYDGDYLYLLMGSQDKQGYVARILSF